ncbi:MAG: symmetrical bis(5-nucleosyl)-tetraphosphatase [Hydrocarboniphaga sp.]|uniref:symmetrical bis(5'-nucleosyl)-tetraphosphatase n=1 Tax=Hydrocarboniphaga sp. TaxID=2033016 RepID=UPI002605687C|nr:symmetrical bis(5'-nucleosyl)-tetraphosphatase [Hydrocarboniphaga sp.]MDB5972396.1 symmetrical bis(5-nucleosyl)-tetraphosphatase [Hydrocarboniphaga sp.]
MSTYAIGDLQGCYEDFRRLLDRVSYDPSHDRLLLAGDLVNRGPQSLECLRFARDNAGSVLSVLGNHDLHLLACAGDRRRLKPGDTVDTILDAPDAAELLDWLAAQPLAAHDPDRDLLMIHAGVPPQWDLQQTLSLAAEASATLAGADRAAFFAHMYGDRPSAWDESLSGWDRTRFVINCLTRLRYCSPQGELAMKPKGAPGSQAEGLLPWFMVPGRRTAGTRIVFGHWSTLGRVEWPEHRVWGLDTGCVWGASLTALDVDTGRLITAPCQPS